MLVTFDVCMKLITYSCPIVLPVGQFKNQEWNNNYSAILEEEVHFIILQKLYILQDKQSIDPFPVPLVIIGGKYDKFEKYEPDNKKVMCRALRYTS